MVKNTKKIGSYLLDDQACDRKAVNEALKKQSSLEALGEYKSMGQIMVESGTVAPEDLKKGLKQQWIDMLSAAELFQSLSVEQVGQIAGVAEDKIISKKYILFSQGDPGETYWLIISGEVRVYRLAGNENEVELARLQNGDGFGEMSLLTGEPRSASVETVRASRFLVIHKNDFDQVVNHSPELTVAFAKILADRLSRGNVSLEKASAKERAYQRFVSEYQTGPQFELIGKSRLLEKLRKNCSLVSGNTSPALLSGPPGTEKKSVSWYIHKEGSSAEAPFLFVDIKNVTFIHQPEATSMSDPLQMELAQDSTLFGHLKGALPFARTNRLGLLQVGNSGTVVIDNVESLAPSMQIKLLEFLRNGCFQPLGKGDDICSSVRIICCTSIDLQVMAEKGFFNMDLYSLLAQQSLQVVPLRRRKKDLGLLVNYLVRHYSLQLGKSVTGVDQKAYHEIMAYDWPGNMDELEVVVRRAVNLAANEKLAPEDLFIGLTPAIGKFTYNLLQLKKVKKLFASSWYPVALQSMSGAFFLYIFYLGFWGTQHPESNASLVLAWGIWEPAVIISTIFAARIWCGICPVGAISSLCSQYLSFKLPVPQFLRKYGFYLSGIGLGIIVWSEVSTHMITSPRATAFMIASIGIFALVFGMVFKRRSWCRYLCPLGKMVGVFAGASMLELRANYGICNNDCISHSCYTGGKECLNGCPMFEGPFSLRSNLDCVLCGNCIKNCPNQSPQVNLRLPGFELWSSRRFEKPVAFMVPLIIGTQLFRGLEGAGYFHNFMNGQVNRAFMLLLLLTAVTALVFLAFRWAERVILKEFPDKNENSAGFLSYGMLFMAVSFEVAFHVERLLLFGGQILPVLGRQLGFHWEAFGASGSAWAITSLQVMFILLGSWGSSVVLRRIYQGGFADQPPKTPINWRLPVFLTTICYIWLFIAG
ncbi:sigma 54-interacting transcriptional regulator [Thermodesulfobacteriota bacterium]